jgi:hypothetical protein
MLLGEWWSACTKLYHHKIFKNLRFPWGRNNEDYAILVKVFEQCNQFLITIQNYIITLLEKIALLLLTSTKENLMRYKTG